MVRFPVLRPAGWLLLGAALPVLVGLSGCNTVPVTGRKSLNFVDDKALNEESRVAFEELKRKYKVSTDPAMNATLQRVCARLAEQLPYWDQPLDGWDCVVFDEPQTVNALAMPGGRVAVFSGAFAIATTDDQLAVIVAHEIAHVTSKHVHERVSRQMLVNAGGTGIGLMTGGLAGLGLQQAYTLNMGMAGLSFDREKESEADYIGLIYMARAGYNPRAAVELWEKLDQTTLGKKVPEEWLSTHPSHENRITRLYGWMAEAEAEYEKARGNSP
jgi:predicted Zn-dependent protease